MIGKSLYLLVFVLFAAWFSMSAPSVAQNWQPNNPPACLLQPTSTTGLTAGPEVIVTKHSDSTSPHFAASALRLSNFPKDVSKVKIYCKVNRQPCVGKKCFGVHLSSIGITQQPDGTARIFVVGWNDNRNDGKDYYLQMFANLPEGGVIGPTP